jgi:hypothetical protein
MGKYGTNLEGFGGFEGGVNADKGAPLVSTSSDGETALLFGPAALREIQAGVANGDFAIPPDDSTATITSENPLPYWTFTDVNSAGAITCAVVADAASGSGNVLQWTVNSGTLTGKSAKITRYIPISATLSRTFSYYIEASFTAATNSAQSEVTVSGAFYKSDLTVASGSFTSGANPFASFTSTTGLNAPAGLVSGTMLSTTAPSDAAFILVTIAISTVATQSAARTIKLAEVTLMRGQPALLITDQNAPQTYEPALIIAEDGDLTLRNGSGASFLLDESDSSLTGNFSVAGDTDTGGLMTAANIASGLVNVIPVANTSTGVAVTGLSVLSSNATAGLGDFSVVVSANSAADAVRTTTYSNLTFSGATLTGLTARVFRTNTTTTGISYIVIGR